MNPIRTTDDLPERPKCDDLMLRFHGFEDLAESQRGSETQGAALQRALGARYDAKKIDVPWSEEDAREGRLNILLSALDRSGFILEHGETVVTPIPPANTQHFGTIDFTVTKKKVPD